MSRRMRWRETLGAAAPAISLPPLAPKRQPQPSAPPRNSTEGVNWRERLHLLQHLLQFCETFLKPR
jgi:hypothetical protein